MYYVFTQVVRAGEQIDVSSQKLKQKWSDSVHICTLGCLAFQPRTSNFTLLMSPFLLKFGFCSITRTNFVGFLSHLYTMLLSRPWLGLIYRSARLISHSYAPLCLT